LNDSKNICFFNTTPFWGGGEKWHFEAAEMMSKTQHKTFFVTSENGELAKRLASVNVTPFYISTSNLSFLNPIKTNRLVEFYLKNEIDTVIFNSPNDLKLGGRAAKKANIATIVYRRGIAIEVKKKRLNQHLFKNVVTHFIFNSKSTKSLLQKNFGDFFNTKKTAVIYNAIYFPGSPNTQQSTINSPIVIGNAGRLVEQKGQQFLIEIANVLKGKGVAFKIEIAGDGPLHQNLMQQIEHNNLSEHIKLLGFVSDMKAFMKRIDIFVSTALWEGFGFVLAEAMVEKKPVLAFDLSSNPELIKDNENGFLIPPKNIDLFAEKLETLINHVDQRKTMGENGYLFAKENFEKEKQFKKLLDFVAS